MAVEKRVVQVDLRVVAYSEDGKPVGEFVVLGEAAGPSDRERVVDLMEQAVLRAGKKARAMAAGVDNNEKARLK